MNTSKVQCFFEGVWTAFQPFFDNEEQQPIQRKHFTWSKHENPYAKASKEIERAFEKVGQGLHQAMKELDKNEMSP